MSKILESLQNTVIAGVVLTVILFIMYWGYGYSGSDFGPFFLR